MVLYVELHLFALLLTVITSLGTVMMPRIANTFASGEKEKINVYMKKSFNMVFLLAFPMIFGIIAVSKAFVPVFFGPGYDKVAILMCVISPIILLIGLFIIACINLTKQKNEAVNNCMKNHSKNYCERIAG